MRIRQLSDGEREIWNEMQRDAAPGPDDINVLRDKRGVIARKHHNCDQCSWGGINPGEPYHLLVMINEGKFEIMRFCMHGDFDERGCRRDQAALEQLYQAEERAMREAEAAAEDLYNWHISGDLPEEST